MGRKVFIEAFKERMELVFQHPILKRKVTYRTAIKLDCYKLIKEIMEDKDFAPFSLKGGFLDGKKIYNYTFVFYDVNEKRVQKVFKECKKYLSQNEEKTVKKLIKSKKNMNGCKEDWEVGKKLKNVKKLREIRYYIK